MPTVVFASPKGGAGKTTSALTLATRLALGGVAVTIIDADPQQYIGKWAARREAMPENLTVVVENDEDNIVEAIEAAAEKTPFVIVDLEGQASKMVLLAVSQADIVLIPMMVSPMDADMAAKTLRVVYQQEKLSRRPVRHSVFITKQEFKKEEKYVSRSQKDMLAALRERGIPILVNGLPDLDAYRQQFAYGALLEELPPRVVPNIPKAVEYAQNFMTEVIERLREPATSVKKEATV